MTAKYQKSYGVEAYLQFVGKPLVMSMTVEEDSQVFTVDLKDFTLKDLITGIVQIVKPGYELSIPVPWSYILEFNIPEFKLLLKAPKKPNSKIEFGISFDPGFDDFGLKITNIEVFARSIREVNINMKGSLNIFGLEYDLSNLFEEDGVNLLGAEGLPQPAPKPSIFDLKFIGIGQHLQLKNAAQYNHVNEVVDAMIGLFDPPAPGTVVPPFSDLLQFNNDSAWLFGLDVEIMKTVALQIVFNDPVLYGLYLKLSGERAKVLAGLEFEILYKKITDDIGVYQIELKLPDAIRNMQFGAVSITLPVIGIWIYTNGNFKIDFGFPYKNDFSRSFAVQAIVPPGIPLLGQGGFYFAYLNGATSTTVPKTDLGSFNPVLEFGLGLNVGLGKTFNKGILKAGITLTFYGILEGTLAWFTPYENAPVDKNLTDFFYKVKGTFGIMGHIYGTVNFAIISATLDILVYVQTTVTIEAAAPIYLSFEAGVSLRLTVKINLGLFKIKIHLSFSATVRESFVLGSHSNAQWNTPKLVTASAINGFTAAPRLTDTETNVLIPMNWDQHYSQGSTAEIPVNLIPLFSANKSSDQQNAIGVASLFIENNREEEKSVLKSRIIAKDALATNSPFKPFDRLCISVLGWILNTTFKASDAAQSFEELLTKKITNVTIANILYTLDHFDVQDNPNPNNGTVPFTYEQAVAFIKALFVVNIVDPNSEHKKNLQKNSELTVSADDQSNLFVTVFPMIPQLFMTNSKDSDVVDFNNFNNINESYLKKVLELVKQFTSEEPEDNDNAVDLSQLESMATHIFRDYFLLIGKSLLQTASDIMEVYQYELPAETNSTLEDIATQFSTSPEALVTTNKAQENLLTEGNKIIVPDVSYSFEQTETFEKLEALHTYVSSGDEWATSFVSLNNRVQLFIPLTELVLPNSGKPYRVLVGDTFETIAKKNKLSTEQVAKIISLNANNDKILADLTAVRLPAFNVDIPNESTFLSIATHYGIELDSLAIANSKNDGLLTKGSEIIIEYVAQLTIKQLLNAVYQKDFFTSAGGNASRFAMHGIRLPNVITDGDPGNELEGLYTLSGQQFTLPKIKDPNSFEYTLTLRKTKEDTNKDPLSWILFNGISFTGSEDDKKLATLPYSLLKDEIKLAQQFQKISFGPTILSGPDNLKLFHDQAKTFAFANPISWEKAGNTPFPAIWNFSKSLIGTSPKRPQIDLKLAVQNKPNAPRTTKPLDQDTYYYTTLIPLSIQKIEAEVAKGINKNTFEVFGTDTTGIELLTALLEDAQFESVLKDLTILYPSDPSNDEARALRSISSEDLLLLLINTNLSTETNPQNTTKIEGESKISNTPVTTFVERVWKSSLVRTGGYYLYYKTENGDTLPETIFSESGEAEIYILLSYNQPNLDISPNIVQPYMNSVITKTPIDTAQELLFGEWNVNLKDSDHKELLLDGKIERNAIINPGNVGFEVSRENPNKKYGNETGEVTEPNFSYDLEQQYNLLNFKTVEGNHFKALNSVIPVGPKDNSGSTAGNGSETGNLTPWKYTKAIPVAKCYKFDDSQQKPLLPPPAHLSPYIGLTETLTINFDWQDNYGNIFDTSVPDLSYTILYFDEIIPLSAWPALTPEYAFVKPENNSNNFVLNLIFFPADKYSWNPKGEHAIDLKNSVLEQAKSDLTKYISVYYQIIQPDLSITFNASVNPDTTYPTTPEEKKKLKTDIVTYLNTVTKWISDFIADPDANNQFQDPNKPIIRYRYIQPYTTAIDATNTKDIFPLSIAVHFSRDGKNIDPQFILKTNPDIFVPGVQSVTTFIKPKTTDTKTGKDENNTASDLLALTTFAQNFEQAFGNEKLKVTASYIRGEDSSLTTEREEELWVVRFKPFGAIRAGIGYDIKFDEALYYAPQPLANFLIALDNIEIYPFAHYQLSGETTSAISKSFNNIDPEIWARNFLTELETTFAPNMSLPITMIDHLNGAAKSEGILAGLLKAKEMLAQAISLQTIPILQDAKMQNSGWKIAQEKLRQQLLINLIDGYSVNAVIQYNTNVNSPYPNDDQPIAPNLYGKPFVDTTKAQNKEKNYSFSTGKIPIRDLDTRIPTEQNTYLTYTFNSKTPTLEANLPLLLNYQINHLEYDITQLKNHSDEQNLSNLENYDLSKWLTFIIPVNAQENNDKIITHIPIPIRQYPTLPAFGSQVFNPRTKHNVNTIEEAKLSLFKFDYSLFNFVAQDTYHFEVYFNAKQADWPLLERTKSLTKKQKVLFSELAQFEAVRKDFINLFKRDLPKVDASMSQDELNQLTKVLGSYEDLVTAVATAWLDLYTPDKSIAAIPSVDVVKVTFELNERGSNPEGSDNYFEVTITNWSVTVEEQSVSYVHFPTIKISDYLIATFVCDDVNCAKPIPLPEGDNPADYKQIIYRYYKKVGEEVHYLTFDEGIKIKKRTVEFTDLSVLQVQNGWAGFYVERNADLSGVNPPLETSPEFIYSTPVRRFNTPITPSSKILTPLPIAPLEGNNNLIDYLKDLLKRLLSTPEGKVTPVKLKVLTNYSFIPNVAPIQLPVLLIPPTVFDAEDVNGTGTGIQALNNGILDWFNTNRPIQNKGKLSFSVTFYSSMDGENTLPLLSLQDLTLVTNVVADIKALAPQ